VQNKVKPSAKSDGTLNQKLSVDADVSDADSVSIAVIPTMVVQDFVSLDVSSNAENSQNKAVSELFVDGIANEQSLLSIVIPGNYEHN
jgi:hypothetical protein